MFLDEAKINIKAGNGGAGSVSFFYLKDRVKKIACGGNGGKGGDIIIEASSNLSTLYVFKDKVHYKAQDGQRGSSNKKAGKNGEDLYIQVPVGTVIKNQKGEVLIDLDKEGDKFIAAKGGRGGRGNASFVSQRFKFPSFAEKGEETEEIWLNLELRLVADVALVGFPNAGKSTLISMVSNAKPKIADYPFTTLTPNLGVVYFKDDCFTIADIPGLIKGAHLGVGPGDKFLRHIMRTILIVIVLDCQEIVKDINILKRNFLELREELKQYNQSLYDKKYIIAINKIDLISDRKLIDKAKNELLKITDAKIINISAKTGENINEFIKILSENLKSEKNIYQKKQLQKSFEDKSDIRIYELDKDDLKEESIKITLKNNEYFIENKLLERMVAMTDLDNVEALDYLKNKLKKMGIGDKLKKMGVKEGSTVIIGKLVFELID
ncbi:MAG: GTPase ObgE [Actinobacteria bacterium]|nr:GTPase ObgE [Cyanobacteriota bacterium]MCL5771093.1 GTPase ObgE [Actinomycetota bacterium]